LCIRFLEYAYNSLPLQVLVFLATLGLNVGLDIVLDEHCQHDRLELQVTHSLPDQMAGQLLGDANDWAKANAL
jgi:hypothetical protein